MSLIPEKALKLGAESLFKYPVRYSKSDIAGSENISYILHSKGACMPGQANLFIQNGRSKPLPDSNVNENRVTREFKLEKYTINFGIKYPSNSNLSFSYDQYHPNDDESLQISINAAYRQIYGNLNAFESERPIESERRLRNGDLTIREFVRQLAKSPFYRKYYFESISQQRSIELNVKHLLGRPTYDQSEIIKYIKLINSEGFEAHIDLLIDSDEYREIFGDHTVPFMRSWDSSCGLKTSSFINSISLTKAFATSDNALSRQRLEKTDY